MLGKIRVEACPNCGKEYKGVSYCYECRISLKTVEREKKQVNGKFKVTDWFSSRSSAGLTIENTDTHETFDIYMSDIFKFFKDVDLGALTLEETKKGSAYSWKILTEVSE